MLMIFYTSDYFAVSLTNSPLSCTFDKRNSFKKFEQFIFDQSLDGLFVITLQKPSG